MNGFFQRLKERKLVQWAVAYIAAAFALLQGLDIVANRFDLPSQTVRLVMLAMILGFFVTLVLAWYHGERGAQRVAGMELLILALLLAVGGGFLWRFASSAKSPEKQASSSAAGKEAAAPIPDKSVAVLPFVSLSKDEENAFFADGVQDQILTNLAKVAGLKVISRTSVMQYRNAAARNLREVGQQLGVAHVLEGSVQRASGKVRVTAQLIDARNDEHEWAENYDRPIADVFAIQSEIAKAIAEQLKVRISPGEEAAISKPPTTDLIAQNLYIKAKELSAGGTNDPNSKRDLLEGVRLVNEAVARDPKFFLGYCLLATLHDNLYWTGFDHTKDRLALEQAALEAAARLQPGAGELNLGRALYFYHAERDYDRARSELALAGKQLPNSAEVFYLRALIDRRQSHWDDALRNFARALELDPRNFEHLYEAGLIYQGLRRYSESSQLYERALAIRPEYYFVRSQLSWNPLYERGDIGPLQKLVASGSKEQPDWTERSANDALVCGLARRDSELIKQTLAVFPASFQNEGTNFILPRDWFVGLAARALGDNAMAQSSFEKARALLEKIVSEQPDYAEAWSFLGLTDAGLGRKDEAIREGRHACELRPVEADALAGPYLVQNLAQIYAWTGEKDLAFETLSRAAKLPFGASYGELKLLPHWDALRGDPRFEQILSSLAPK